MGLLFHEKNLCAPDCHSKVTEITIWEKEIFLMVQKTHFYRLFTSEIRYSQNQGGKCYSHTLRAKTIKAFFLSKCTILLLLSILSYFLKSLFNFFFLFVL
jgi:hypothetical protein